MVRTANGSSAIRAASGSGESRYEGRQTSELSTCTNFSQTLHEVQAKQTNQGRDVAHGQRIHVQGMQGAEVMNHLYEIATIVMGALAIGVITVCTYFLIKYSDGGDMP